MKKKNLNKPAPALSFKKNLTKVFFRKSFRYGFFWYSGGGLGINKGLANPNTSRCSFFWYREGAIRTDFLLFLLPYFLLSCLISCAHIPDKIDDLSPQSRKSKVLKVLGSPFKIGRENGEDHWIYKFVEEGRHYTMTVVFKDNMLIRKEKRKPYSLKRF